MNTHFDRSTIRDFIKACGQMLLLLSILFAFPVYAAGEEVLRKKTMTSVNVFRVFFLK